MHYSKQLTGETWKDFEKLFEKHKGVRGGCWCTYHMLPSSDFSKMSRQERKDYHMEMVRKKVATGLLLYDEKIPVGWCQFGCEKVFEQINRNRAYKKFREENNINVKWRITCIFVDKEYRRKGISAVILNETIKMIEKLGGGITEAFPFDFDNSVKPNYNGTVRMFEREGFKKAGRIGKNIQLMHKNI